MVMKKLELISVGVLAQGIKEFLRSKKKNNLYKNKLDSKDCLIPNIPKEQIPNADTKTT